MSITVHSLNYSRSLRVLWLLEELGLSYAVKQWERDENFRAPQTAKSIHPLGKFPMVEVDGQVLSESGAILEFFAERNAQLKPQDSAERLQCSFFLHYAEGSLMPPLLMQFLMTKLKQAPMRFFIKPIAKSIARKIEENYSAPALSLHLGFVEQTLGERPYFAGETFSIADIQMIYPVEAGLSRGSATVDRPNMRAWRERVEGREAYQRAVARGGPAMPE